MWPNLRLYDDGIFIEFNENWRFLMRKTFYNLKECRIAGVKSDIK